MNARIEPANNNTIEAGYQARLTQGARISLLSNKVYPAIEIASLNPGAEEASICIRRGPLDTDIRAVDGDGLVIGRTAQHGQPHYVLDEQTISRLHGIFAWDDHGLVYQHNGKNTAQISGSHPTIEPSGASRTFVGKANISASDDVFTLSDGATLQMHPHLNPYKVHITNAGLELAEEGSHDPRQPEHVIISRSKAVASLGRGIENTVRIKHAEISKLHAFIAYDEGTDSFVYAQQGVYPPQITPEQSFFELHKQLRNTVHQLPIDEARQRLAEATNVIAALEENHRVILELLRLERATALYKPGDMHGARTEDSQKGYALWLRAAELLYRDTLAPDQRETIRHMANVIDTLGKDRECLRTIERQRDLTDDDVSERVSELAKQRVADLTTHGEVYLTSGFRGHHTVTRLRHDNGTYYLTTYNAGAGAAPDPDDPRKILGVVEREIVPGTNLEALITTIATRKMRSSGSAHDRWGEAIEQCLGATVRSASMYPQNKGNCTTRSTREAIRDVMSEGSFAMIHQHIHDAEIANAEAIIQVANDLKTTLEKRIANEKFKSSTGRSLGA